MGDFYFASLPGNWKVTLYRQLVLFNVTHPNSEPIKRSVMYAGALEWNSLESDVRNIKDSVSFKRNKKTWMLNTFVD